MADVTFTITVKDDGTPVLKNIKRSVDEAGKGLEDAGKRGGRGIDDLTNKMRTAASVANTLGTIVGIGAVASAAGLAQFVLHATSAIARLQDLSEQSGVSASKLAAIKPILENSGSSVEEFVSGMRSLQRQMVEGSEDVVRAMGDLGISVEDMLRLTADPEGAIDALTKGLAAVENQGKSTHTVMEVLSRAGFRLAPALKEIGKAGGLAALKSPITDEEIKAIDELGDAFNTAKLKAEAFAAVSLLKVIGEIKELWSLAQQNPFALLQNPVSAIGFNIGQRIAAARQGQAAAAAAAGSKIGAAAGVLNAPGLAETKAQTEFKKALDDQIASLRTQKLALTEGAEAAIANAAEIIKTKAAAIGLTEASGDLTKKLEEFKATSLSIAQGQLAQQLEKQNQSIEVQIATMTQGAAAGEALALKYVLLDSKLKNVGEAALAAAEKQRRLNVEQARAAVPQALRELGDAKDIALRKQVTLGINFNADEAVRQAVESAIDKLVSNPDPRVRALALEAALKLKPELDKARIDSIKTELQTSLTLDREFGALLNQTFTNTFDAAAAKVAALESALQKARQNGVDPLDQSVQKLAADLDKARFDQAAANLQREFTIAANQARVFGDASEASRAAVQALQSQIEQLIRAGLDPMDARLQSLAQQLRAAKFDQVFVDVNRSIREADETAQVLGVDFDSTGAKISAVTQGIRELIKQKIELEQRAELTGIFDPAEAARIAAGIDVLKEKLQELKVEAALERMADGIAGAFERALNSTGSALDRLKNLVNDVLSSINRELTKLLITDPLKEWLKEQMKVVLPKIGLPVPSGQGPGAPGGAPAGADPAAIAAIQATQASATAAIQAETAISETAVQTLLSAGELAISTTESVAITSIEAVQAVAIAAIEAAAAAAASGGGAGGGGGLLGSLFGGSSGGDLFSGEATGYEAGFFERGGIVGVSSAPQRWVDSALFHDARRYEQGGMAGLAPGEVPVIAHKGEIILNREQSRRAMSGGKEEKAQAVHVTANFNGVTDMASFTRSSGKISAELTKAVQRAIQKGFSN
jgi:Arc/MetJ-type ribon-helix-helix transcriptional regulator